MSFITLLCLWTYCTYTSKAMKCCQWSFSLHIIYFAMENETIQFLSTFFSLSSMSFLFMLTQCRQSVPPRFLLRLYYCPSSQSAHHWRTGTFNYHAQSLSSYTVCWVLCTPLDSWHNFFLLSRLENCPAAQSFGCCACHWRVGTLLSW